VVVELERVDATINRARLQLRERSRFLAPSAECLDRERHDFGIDRLRSIVLLAMLLTGSETGRFERLARHWLANRAVHQNVLLPKPDFDVGATIVFVGGLWCQLRNQRMDKSEPKMT